MAILGSIASAIYRSEVTSTPVDGLPASVTGAAGESLVAAGELARQLDAPQLAEHAADAFTDALRDTGLIGGIALAAVAVGVYLLTPRGINVAGTSHH